MPDGSDLQDRERRTLRRRAAALVALAALVTAAYLGTLARFDLAPTPQERRFGSDPGDPDRLLLYLEPVSIDPVNGSLLVRIYVTPGAGLQGRRVNTLNRDVTLDFTNGDYKQQRVFHADEAIPPEIVQLDLERGSVVAYPLDRYRLDLRLRASASRGAEPDPVAEEITVWEQILGFKVRSSRADAGHSGDITLRLEIRRTDAQIFFALAAYASMAVVACCALAIAGLVFLGRRKVEAALTCALGPIVFALPALRNTLPGAPPVGVWADLAVFLWAELATVIALALFVLAWARQRP